MRDYLYPLRQFCVVSLLLLFLVGCERFSGSPEGRYHIDLQQTAQGLTPEKRSAFIRANLNNKTTYDILPDKQWLITMTVEGKQLIRRGSWSKERGYFEFSTTSLNDGFIKIPPAKVYRKSGSWVWEEAGNLSPKITYLLPEGESSQNNSDLLPLMPDADADSELKISEVQKLVRRQQSSALNFQQLEDNSKCFHNTKLKWKGKVENFSKERISVSVGTLAVKAPLIKKRHKLKVGAPVEIEGQVASIFGRSIILFAAKVKVLSE